MIPRFYEFARLGNIKSFSQSFNDNAYPLSQLNKDIAFEQAARFNQIAILQLLIEKNSEDIKRLVNSPCYHKALTSAARFNHLAIVKFLLGQCPENQRHALITQDNCDVFRLAARYGFTAIVELLLQAVENKPFMIASKGYYALEWACKNNHLKVLQFLLKEMDFDSRQQMIKYNNYDIYQQTAFKNRFKIIKILLNEVIIDPIFIDVSKKIMPGLIKNRYYAIVDLILQKSKDIRNFIKNQKFKEDLFNQRKRSGLIYHCLERYQIPKELIGVILKRSQSHPFFVHGHKDSSLKENLIFELLDLSACKLR